MGDSMQSAPGLVRSTRRRTPGLFWLLAVAGIALRLYVSQLGFNDDLHEWQIVADLSLKGNNVFASTDRFSYGPAWLVMLHGLAWVQLKLNLAPANLNALHANIAGFLSLVDIAVAWCLFQRGGMLAAVFFVLNPVLILLTGYHSQVDTLAVFWMLLAWMLIEPATHRASEISWWRVWGSAALVAASLATKHVMLFFPLWLFFAPSVIPDRRKRLVSAAAAWGLFLLSFVPFAFAPGAIKGMWEHVFSYTGLPSHRTLIGHLLELITPTQTFERLLPGSTVKIEKGLFIACMCGLGWRLGRDRPGELFERYLLAMMSCLVSAAPQYLAIPLAACAMMWRRWPTWIYAFTATAFLLVSPWNISNLYITAAPWVMTLYKEFAFWHVQIWTAILLLSGWIIVKTPHDPHTQPADAGGTVPDGAGVRGGAGGEAVI
jgi:fumarate reductase subunit D